MANDNVPPDSVPPDNGAGAIMGGNELLKSILGDRVPEADPVAAEAARAVHRRGLTVHSTHVLLQAEMNTIQGLGQNKDNYAAVPLSGQVGINRDNRTGQMFLMMAAPIPPDFFPALDQPLLQADGGVSAPRFDRALGCPITVRVVIEYAGMGELLRKRIQTLVEHEGKTFGELEDTGYPFIPALSA